MHNDFRPFIAASVTPVVVANAGHNVFIHTILVAKVTVGTVTVANKNATPVTQFVLPIGTGSGTYIFDSLFTDGLVITNSSAADVVILNGYQL